MRCEDATCLISARLDGEVNASERVQIEAHLATCESCRAVDAAIREQDARLRAGFDRRRDAAGRVAFQTIARVRGHATPARMAIRWSQVIGAMAAGFALAMLVFQPWESNSPRGRSIASIVDAQLAVATGPVEIREADQPGWTRVSGPVSLGRGARVRTTGDVRCELRTRTGATIRLDADTEFLLVDAGRGELIRGQVWSNTMSADRPLRLAAMGTTIIASAAEFDASREDVELIVTAVYGAPEIVGRDASTILADGESVRLLRGVVAERWCEHDAVFATRWVHDLLRKRPANAAEFDRRIDALLAGMDTRRPADAYESEIRTFGGDSAVPLARFLRSQCAADPERAEPHPTRTAAARILADLAPPRVIPDLIELLTCGDREVRYHAARALERLTAVDQGMPTSDWRESPCDPCAATTESWREWWEQNQSLFADNS